MSRPHVVLYLVGIALSVAQFLMIRDFVSILYGEEVVIVLVTATFFLGLSAGYLLSLRLGARAFRGLFVGSVFLHLTFPFSYRYLASWLADNDAGGYAFMTLLVGYAFVFNTVFATFLPRIVAEPGSGDGAEDRRLRLYYPIELAGFISGFVLVGLSWNRPLSVLLVPYWAVVGLLLHGVIGRLPLTAAFAALALLAAVFLAPLDLHSTALLYETKHGIRDAKVLYSVNSAYQKVEVVEDRRGTLHLYLDGLENLNSTDLESLNYFIALVPAALVRPEQALLIGNGTLTSVSKVYPHSGHVTSVELDAGVLQAGRLHFTPPETLATFERWELHVDDGKHFLRTTQQRFDLIVVDVPSPLTIQEAYLHSVEFYRLASRRLTPTGVIAVQLSGPLQKNNRSPARITAGLQAALPQVMVVDSERADRSFAYASFQLPFDAQAVRDFALEYDPELEVIPPEEIRGYLEEAQPISMTSMDLVLRRGWERFAERYFE
jgi:spermidine synthase